MDGLTIGRNIHYVNPVSGLHCPALVTYVWSKDKGLINLGGFSENGDPLRAISVSYDEVGTRGTWHWIERA